MTALLTSRRGVLRLLATALAGAAAGCSEAGDTAANGTDGGADAGTGTATETATATTTEDVGTDVSIVASYPVETDSGTEQRETTVLTAEDFADVGAVQTGASRPPYVPVTLTGAAAENYTAAMREYGFTSPSGIGACRYEQSPDDPGYCLQTVLDGEVVYSASMSAGLAQTIDSGEFSSNPRFVLQTDNRTNAEQLRAALEGNQSDE